MDRHIQKHHLDPRVEQYKEFTVRFTDTKFKHEMKNTGCESEYSKSYVHPSPSSSIHMIMIPSTSSMIPFDQDNPLKALNDPACLRIIRSEAAKVRSLVCYELAQRFGRYSAADQPRQRVLDGDVELGEDEDPPVGRVWEKDVMVGVERRPEIGCFHVHILSRDMMSRNLTHYQHYNRFATRAFIPLEAFPLTSYQSATLTWTRSEELKCWRCEQKFGYDIAKFKWHLADEFEAWRAE